MAEPSRQPYYRLERGTTNVPNEAPRDLAWHDLGNAIRDVEAWVRANPEKVGHEVGDTDGAWFSPKHEYRVAEVVILPADTTVKDAESDCSGGCPYAAVVKARVYVERRRYRIERKPLAAVVDGVTLSGFGPEEKVYEGEWFAGWIDRKSWLEGDRAYVTAYIPIVCDEMLWGDRG